MFHSLTLLAPPLASSDSSWLGIAFPCYFIGMWLGLSAFMAYKGWARFARVHACRQRPAGNSYKVPYANFGSYGPRYKGTVRAVATEAGIYFSMTLIFRPFHKPFLLPWSSVAQASRLAGWFDDGFALYIQDPVGKFEIRIIGGFEAELRRFAPALLGGPSTTTIFFR